MGSTQPLSGEGLRMAVEPWLEELGKSDRERLEKAVALAVAGRVRLSECLQVLFPDKEGPEALQALTSFRKRVNDASEGTDGADLGLRFEVDSKKKNPPEERYCWFTGPDPAVKQAERYSNQVTADVVGKPQVHAKGLATTTGTANAPGKRKVRCFVSYAHDNRALVEALMKELSTHFAASARYELIPWIDQDILVGDKWRQSIEQGIQSCDFGLMMVSPAFFASKFIREKELPHFVGPEEDSKRKPVLPVGVEPVAFGTHDLKGLEEHQFFLMRTPRTEGRYYDQMNGRAMKRDFVFKLYLSIEKRLNAFFASASPRESKEGDTSALADHVPVPEETRYYQRNRAHRLALHESERLDLTGSRRADELQARDALDELTAWATNPQALPFFALLGEYGIGKTTTLKQFTRRLMEARRADPSVPLPIYIDLRSYVGASKDSVPTIEQLLTSVIERSWKVSHRNITAQDVLRLVREEGAVILFDGLDEKIVHLPPDRAQDFIRTLWASLPDAARTPDALPEGKRRGKLLISCRSHYFRDVSSQNAMLVGEDREGIDRKHFPTLCLLPFTQEQIQSYLADFLGSPERGAEAVEIIQSIHNLRDLAERPVLLSFISGHLGELEALKARGEPVNAARLYELVVKSWIDRDNGKHQLDPLHKRRLMEELAAALWRDGTKQWDVEKLETWLDEYLAANPALSAAYANKDRTVLKEDLRTATLVLRPTEEERHFRFAHTSLQEYFLAVYLKRALVEGKLERWDLPDATWEAVDFLGQLLQLEPEQTKALRALESLLAGDTLSAAKLAFAYWMRALAQGYPVPTPARVKLAGANLEGWSIQGRGASQLLELRRANLSNVRLNRARLEHVELGDAQLTGLQARQAVFLNVNAPRSSASGSDLRGLRWRKGSLADADLRESKLDGCQWIRVNMTGTQLPERWEQQASAIYERQSHSWLEGARLALLQGHAGLVTACGWSPDGTRVVSGAHDWTVKVWDTGSGECLRTLSGHEDVVTVCGWSPDGTRVVSGSSDSTVKVWDAESGECVRTLSGHEGSVTACGWSPDGTRVVSGSSDGTVKVWDAGSGECLRTLSGHEGGVTACGWSPDGARVVSGAYDGTVKVWDAGSGECLLTLSGHASGVAACRWSPDGTRVVSGSSDGTVKVWDTGSGECLRTLSGHEGGVTACGWSPDGTRVVSGSSDGTVKVWDVGSGGGVRTLSGHAGVVTACEWSPDGTRVVSGAYDGTVKVWDTGSGECLLTLSRHAGLVTACGWSPDGTRVVSGAYTGTVRVWDAGSGKCLQTLLGHEAWVRACGWSPDGTRVVSGSSDGTVKVWDAGSGECLLTLSGHSDGVTACGWSPDGTRVVSGAHDRTVKVWDAESGECLRTLSGHEGLVTACGWSPDGTRVVSGSSDGTVKVWDAESGECLRMLSGHKGLVTACGWSPDGTRVVSGASGRTVKVWDAESGECLRTLSGHSDGVTACGWSPDGTRVVSGAHDRTVKVWDAGRTKCLLTLNGHKGGVTACGWSPDGTRVVSGAEDGTMRMWDAGSGQCVWSAHLLPEGQTASVDGAHERILHASAEAWRWLGWRWTDPATGDLRILPAEIFGPLPT